MTDNISSYLALNVRQLRSARQLSQVQLAQLAGIPRPTLAHLESGVANPTLSVLMRLASALQVLIEELVAPPRSLIKHFKADELPHRQRGAASVRKLLPNPLGGLDVERMELPVGADFVGIPHMRGSRKYVVCERGEMTLSFDGDRYTMAEGDLLVFRGDQRHSYTNVGAGSAVAFGIVTLAPVPE